MLRPMPVSDSSSVTSRSRHDAPLIRYSDAPERSVVRAMLTSVMSSGKMRELLSKVSSTSATPRRGRWADPAKMTSSIDPPLRLDGAWEPSTHDIPSAMLDFPDPLGPTIVFTPGSNSRIVGSANDLKPAIRTLLTNIRARYQRRSATPRKSTPRPAPRPSAPAHPLPLHTLR